MAAEAPSTASNTSRTTAKLSVEVQPLHVKAGTTAEVAGLLSIAAPVQDFDTSGPARAPLRLCAIIDCSSSMEGEKIKLVKETLEFVISQLTADDFFSIVVFSTSASTHMQLTKMTPENKKSALQAVKKIWANGRTNLSDGLFEGLSTLLGPSVTLPHPNFDVLSELLRQQEDPCLTLRAKTTLRSRPHGGGREYWRMGFGYGYSTSLGMGTSYALSNATTLSGNESPCESSTVRRPARHFSSSPTPYGTPRECWHEDLKEEEEEEVEEEELGEGGGETRAEDWYCEISVDVREEGLAALVQDVTIKLPSGVVLHPTAAYPSYDNYLSVGGLGAPQPTSQVKRQFELSPAQYQEVVSSGQQVRVHARVDLSGQEEIVFPITLADNESVTEERAALIEARQAKPEESRAAGGEGDRAKKDEVLSCFLFTDGKANGGIVDTQQLCAKAAQHCNVVKQYTGIKPSVYTFGFGEYHSDGMLRATAEACSGMYYFIESSSTIAASFADALGGLLSVAMVDVELQLQPVHGAKLVKVETTYSHRTDASGSVFITFGEVFSEETRDILVQLSIPEVTSAEGEEPSFPYLHSTLRYRSIASNANDEKEADIRVYRPDEISKDMEEKNAVNIKIEEQRIRLATIDSLTAVQQMEAASGGVLDAHAVDAARSRITFSMEAAMNSPSLHTPTGRFCVAQMSALRDQLSAGSMHDSAHSKRRSAAISSMQYQRSTEVEAEGGMSLTSMSPYKNSSKTRLQRSSNTRRKSSDK